MMRKISLAIIAAAFLAGSATAHEIWVEPTAEGVARIYLGEPDLPMPPGGDPEWRRLQQPLIIVGDSRNPVSAVRRQDHLEAKVPSGTDIRVRDDGIFPPWETDGVKTGAIYYARGGRNDPRAMLDLEIVPVQAGGDEFVVMFRGKPLPNAKVRVLAPGRWQQDVTSDENGRIEPPMLGSGRHILAVTHELDEKATLFDTPVARVQHVSTLTFVR